MDEKIKTMKKLVYITVMAFAMLTLMVSCHKDDVEPTPKDPECDSSNTPFQQLYAATLASDPDHVNEVTMDVITHEYTFRLSVAMQVCQIGYQSQPDLYANNIPIDIEIEDMLTSTVVYTGSYVFDDTQTDYVSIPPVSLQANREYTIRRNVTNHNGLMANRIGRLIRHDLGNPITFPVTLGIMTITGADFYGVGSAPADFGIPFIDVVLR